MVLGQWWTPKRCSSQSTVSALERADPDLGRVDIAGADHQGLGDSCPGVRERRSESLHHRTRVGARRGEESGPLFGGEVLPTPAPTRLKTSSVISLVT